MNLLRPLLLALALLLPAAPGRAADQLTVMLDWFVNPDHGPLVVAQANGMFAAAGLDVKLVAPADPNDPPKLVAAHQADIALTYQPQLHLQVAQGLPVVRIGTLIATPLNSVVVLADGPVRSIADLKGRKVGYSVGGFEDALLGAMLEHAGLKLADVQLVNVNFSLSPSLLAGQVDAVIGAFRNFELNQMDLAGHPGRAFFPEEEGVPAYDELVFIAHRDGLGRPELRRFLTVVEDATTWIVNHPNEAWDVFRATDKALDDELNRRAWTDTVRRLAHRPAALDQGRYRRFADFLAARGLIPSALPVASYAVDLFQEEKP